MLIPIFIVLGVICLGLYFVLKKKLEPTNNVTEKQQVKQKENLGQIQIFYGSQTGTAAKMASVLAEQASQYGFQGIVIDLKNLSHNEFKQNQISIFLMANTGEGEPPQNCIQFMKLLEEKIKLQDQRPEWSNMNYLVFGLGDTQYQHFNKIGIITDQSLEKLGANRIHKICLGDANSSLEDDFIEWKAELWPIITQFRKSNPYSEQHARKKSFEETHPLPENKKYLNDEKPLFANYRFCVLQQQSQQSQINLEDLDFKTKASLNGKKSGIVDIIEKRQDKKYGSSLELQVILEGSPQYQTAGNIALWPQNDPKIISQVMEYFKLNKNTILQIMVLDQNKRMKLNFVSPVTIIELLQTYLDLQFRVTKGLLKKLSKFPSDEPDYFRINSSVKTTEEYKRISQHQFCYLFKLIKKYNIKMCFEDFVELSDSVGPRLFTIASSWKAQKSVAVIASIVEEGLISKHFNRNPTTMKAELRKSLFTSIQQWQKVIFIGAGTGFAPFRGLLQQKQLGMKQGKQFPLITVYFGCKNRNSDFIYRQQINNWEAKKVINKLCLAFSREAENKVYVQHLLARQEDELREFVKNPKCAVYICGSVGMGKDVTKVLEDFLIKKEEFTYNQAKNEIQKWEKQSRLIKQLW